MAGGLLVIAPLVMILFRQKYPLRSFDWNIALLRFINRVGAYLLLLRDEYPSTDDEQHVHLENRLPGRPDPAQPVVALRYWWMSRLSSLTCHVIDADQLAERRHADRVVPA